MNISGINKTINITIIYFILPVFVFCQQAATISGFVTDVESGEALSGANVYLQDTNQGTAANVDGYYVINNVQAGEYTLNVSYIGFMVEGITITVQHGEDLRINVEMSSEVLTGEIVEVTADKENFRRDIGISRVSVNPMKLRTLPQIGEADLFRALQLLPGVRAQSEFSSGLIVRGGNTDQNLILFDGITVYNPSHLGGMFSTFITDGLREAELVKGAYPAEFGGRLSSVLDVRSKDGNSKRFTGSTEVSLLSTKFLVEGPVYKGGWLFTGRRTYVDQVLKMMERAKVIDFEFPYYFYDLQGNFYQNFGDRDRLFISMYAGNDSFDWPEILLDINWGNQTVSGRWRHLFSTRLISTFLVANSRFTNNWVLGGSDAFRTNNYIKDRTAKGDLTYFIRDDRQVKFGFEIKDLDIQYLTRIVKDTLVNFHQKPLQTAFYFDDKWNFHRWVLRYGLRFNYYGQADEKMTLAPRFSSKYLLNDSWAFNLSLGRYYQYIFTVNDEFNLEIISNWIAHDKSVPIQFADQIILGVEFHNDAYLFSLEGYGKLMNNLLVFREQRAAFDESVLEGLLINTFKPTDAAAWGLEFFIEKTQGRLTGNISYALSWVVKQIENEPKYWANWDRRHELKTSLGWKINKKWLFSTSFQFGTGYPYTRMLGTYVYYEPGMGEDLRISTIPGTRNNSRLPTYHRLDISFTKNRTGKRIKWEWYLNIINLYNHRNVLYIDWDIDELSQGKPAEKEELKMFPIIPAIGIRISF